MEMDTTVSRRTVIGVGLGALALAAGGRASAASAPGAIEAGNAALAAAASECVNLGSACLQHCLSSLATGDKMMAACAKAVSDMLAQSRALVDLANSGSKHLKDAAKLASDISRDCEAECRKHEAMSAICKRCADGCAKLIAAAAKV